ncbi:DUF6363 domain-containing protein [Dermatophilus congolensis]|uniref:DUF6363 domain-containing protein n=1 Tax=Dermatophilus congolensis TaxID=1863 RepID=UPI001AB05049|nr:patatin family protein [Dermatophilus congolensis]MBO3187471.1 patatin family protein [Dermatophilus congolensis]
MQLTSNITDTALVFEGGGLRASYTSGLVVSLLEAGLYFNWVGGISAGSSHTANYLSRDVWRARASFTDFADDPQFGGWSTFVRGQGLFNAKYIYQEAGQPGANLPFDDETFQANPAQMSVGAFNASTGESTYWGRSDIDTAGDLMIRVQASSTMPIVMPRVIINDQVFLDGALGETAGIPLLPAQRAGYERFLIVLSRPRDYIKEPFRHTRLVNRWFHGLPAVSEALASRPKRYNALREEIFSLAEKGKAYVFIPETMPISTNRSTTAQLIASYEDGYAQAQKELPAIIEFLGDPQGTSKNSDTQAQTLALDS